MHQLQPLPGDYDRVELAVYVSEFEQIGVAQLLQQVSGDEGFGIGRRQCRGVQDALAHGGFEPAAFTPQRERRIAAGGDAVEARGDIAQGGEVSHQVAVCGRAHRGHAEHRGPPALAPFQEQRGVPAAHGVPQHNARQFRALGGGQRAQLGGSERLQMQVEQVQAAAARGQHSPPAPLRLAPGRLGQPAGTAGAQLATVPGGRCGPQVPGRPPPADREPAPAGR